MQMNEIRRVVRVYNAIPPRNARECDHLGAVMQLAIAKGVDVRELPWSKGHAQMPKVHPWQVAPWIKWRKAA